MKFKKYITIGLSIVAISFMMVGCSSDDVKVNKEIQSVLETKIEESIGDCDIKFGDSSVCGFEFNNDKYDEVLFVNITLKDKSLESLSKEELKKHGRKLSYSTLHKPVHILYDKYMSKDTSILFIQVEDSSGRLVTCESIDNSISSYPSRDCVICNELSNSSKEDNKKVIEKNVHSSQVNTQDNEEIEIRGGYGYCDLCNESYSHFELTDTNLNGQEVTVCPDCLDSINSGAYNNIDMNNAN